MAEKVTSLDQEAEKQVRGAAPSLSAAASAIGSEVRDQRCRDGATKTTGGVAASG